MKENSIEEDIKLVEELINAGKEYKRFEGSKYQKGIEHILKNCKRRLKENEELKEDLKYVLNQTLGAFEKNWCIDYNFTEIREKYNLESE